MSDPPLLRVTRLRIEAPMSGVIVDDVSFDLRQGRVLGLIGASGAGKSTIGLATLAHCRGGCRITGGEVWLNGQEIAGIGVARGRLLRGREVAYVAQSAEAAFNPALRVGAQVIEAAVSHGLMSRAKARAEATLLYAKLGLPDPEEFGRRFPHQLSGGQLQRAMTAMALCCRPRLVVFDEPTTALDATTQIEVLITIRSAIRDAGAAALYISHDLAVVAQLADDIMVLRNGRIVEYGSADQIFRRPQHDYTRRLLGIRSIRKPEVTPDADPVLRLIGITACYGNREDVLKGVSLEVTRGHTLAVVGESGSGKSTLGRLICGLLPRRAGAVLFNDAELPSRLADRRLDQLRQIQMIYQSSDVAMNPRQRVFQIVSRPLELYFGLSLAARRARVLELLRLVGLDEEFLDRFPAELSGGQKQRVCIARALAADPILLICDEITSALDPLVAVGILELLLDIQARTGVTYLFITHDIATVRVVADAVAVMRHGRIVRIGATAAALSPPLDDYTEKLLSAVPEMRLGWLDKMMSRRALSVARSFLVDGRSDAKEESGKHAECEPGTR